MYTGININETKRYISKNDPDKEKPTVFYLGALDRIVMDYIEDNSVEYKASSSDPEAEALPRILFAIRALLVVKFGVRKIENFRDPETKETITIEAEKTPVNGRAYLALPDKVLSILPSSLLVAELGLEITKLGKLSEEAKKN